MEELRKRKRLENLYCLEKKSRKSVFRTYKQNDMIQSRLEIMEEKLSKNIRNFRGKLDSYHKKLCSPAPE